MNKKILAGLMSLGLILGPIGNGQALATEAKTYDQDLVGELILYTSLDESQIGPLDHELKNEYLKLKSDTEDLLDSEEKTDEMLKEKVGLFDDFFARAADAAINSYTKSLIIYRNFFDDNKEILAEKGTYHKDNIDVLTSYLAEMIYGKNEGVDIKEIHEKLLTDTNRLETDILEALKKAEPKKTDEEIKAIVKKEYPVTEEAIKALAPDLEAAHKKMEALRRNRDTLLKDKAKFVQTEAYKKAETSLKETYDKAIKGVEDILDSGYNYLSESKDIEEAYLARTAISSEGLIKSGDEIKIQDKSSEKSKDDQLREKIQEGKKELENSKISQERKKALEKSIKKAEDLLASPSRDEAEIEKAIKDLDEKIKAAKESEKDTDDVKDLKDQISYAKYLKENIFYNLRPKEATDALDKVIKEAEDLLTKENPDKSDLEKTLKNLNAKISDVVFTNPTYIEFAGSDVVEKDLKALVDSRERLESLDVYKKSDDYDKNVYKKALKDADELLKGSDDKKTSKNLKEKYVDLYKSIENLPKSHLDKLKDLVNNDSKFRTQDNYIKAKDDGNEVVDYYNDLIEKAKKIKDDPNANSDDIEVLYKCLNDSIKEINGKINTFERKALAEIHISKIIENKIRKDDSISKDKDKKRVAETYLSSLKELKKLAEEGKLGTDQANKFTQLMQASRMYLDGQVGINYFDMVVLFQRLSLIQGHPKYKDKIEQQTREKIDRAIEKAKEALTKPEDEELTKAALGELESALKETSVKDFEREIQNDKSSENIKDALRTKLDEEIANNHKDNSKTFKYSKAQAALRKAYDLALENAKKIAKDPLSSEDDLRSAYNKLVEAGKNLDGDLFQSRIEALAEKFKKEQLMIKDPNQRQAIAEKINKLGSDPTKTMDDVLAVEREFESLKTQITTTTVPTNQASGLVTTTTPMQTNKNPASIVKTGIESIGKFAIILAAAVIVLIIMNKKGDKNENNK